MEPPHDRVAKRRAEIEQQLAELDDEDSQSRAMDNDPASPIVDRRVGEGVRSAVFLTLVVVVAAGLFGVAVTLSRLAGDDFGDARREGTAQVTSCTQRGPISNKGFGYWDSCTTTIAWNDGSTERVTVDAVFTTADIGAEVRVGDLGRYRTSELLVRADSVHRPWLAWIGYAAGIVGVVPSIVAVLIIRELLRFRRRR